MGITTINRTTCTRSISPGFVCGSDMRNIGVDKRTGKIKYKCRNPKCGIVKTIRRDR